jgi:hypothetical protein
VSIRTNPTNEKRAPAHGELRAGARTSKSKGRKKLPERVPLFKRIVRAGSKLVSRLFRSMVPAPALSVNSREQIDRLIAHMKTETQYLTAMMAETWLLVESATRSLPSTSIPAEIFAQLEREGLPVLGRSGTVNKNERSS